MLRCSKCGTINADGNSFCKSCGTKLDRTSIRCPKCGTLNRIGNIFCDKCQTKLISPDTVVPPEENDIMATPPVKTISLPTRADTDKEPAIPEWLQQLTEEMQAEDPDEDSENSEFQPEDQTHSELPDWLSQLADKKDFSIADDVDKIDSQSDLSAHTQDLPDWLLGEQSESQQHAEEQTPLPELTEQDSILTASSEETPTANFPDWLSNIADGMDSSISDLSSTPDIPDWLVSIADDEDAKAPISSGQPLPVWLQPELDIPPKELPGVNKEKKDLPVAQSHIESVSDSFPDYFEDTESALPETQPDHTAEESLVLDDEAQVKSDVEVQLPGKPLPIDQGEIDIELSPDWLSIPVSDIQEEKEQEIIADSAEEDGIPEWFNTLGKELTTTESATTPKLSSQKVPPSANLPTWLSDLNIQEATLQESQAVFTADDTEALANESQQPDTPAWLDEVSQPSEIIPIQPVAPAFIPSEEVDGLQPDKVAIEPFAAGEELPSWVHDLRLPEPGEETRGSEIQDISLITGEMAVLGTEDIIRAELPEWLHDLAPSEGSTWSPTTALSATESWEDEDIRPAEVPDWVQTLRPKPGDKKRKASEGILLPEPVEIEGPLASLAGILPSSTIVDMPVDYAVNLVKISDNVIKQAQLWQRLLEKPRSAARKVARRERRNDLSSSITRIIISAIFILGSIAAIWLLPSNNLAVISSMDNHPGPTKFVESVDALNVGETVLVAVEFGWAQTGEMTAIANAVLKHLVEQEVRVIAVSTMPEGTAIIPTLLKNNNLSNILSEEDSYLSSSAAGVAGFLKEPEAQSASMLIVLSSNFERTRWWIEQNQNSGNMPITANLGLSASTGPLTAPYLGENNAQAQGWMIGFKDSFIYQALRGQQNTEQTRILDVLLIMHWTAIILLIIGFLYALISGKKSVA